MIQLLGMVAVIVMASGPLLGCAPKSSTAARPPALEPARALQLAVDEHLRRGQLREARKLARAALAASRGDGLLACRLAEIDLRLGDYDRAEAQLRSLAQAPLRPLCRTAELQAELLRLRRPPEPLELERAAILASEGEQARLSNDLETAQAKLLAAWGLQHPNGLRLIEAASIAASRGQPVEARRLADRGITELEQQMRTTVAAEMSRPFDSHVLALEASPSAAQLAVADSRGLCLLDAAFQETRRFSLVCNHLSWPEEHTLLCGMADGRVLDIDPESAQVRERGRLAAPITSVSGQGRMWLATGGGRAIASSGDASVWPLDVSRASAGAISPGAARIAIGQDDGSVLLFDVATREKRLHIKPPPGEPIGRVELLRFSDDGQWLGLTLKEGQARVLGATTGKLRALLPFTGDFRAGPDGRLVFGGVGYGAAGPPDRRDVISVQPPLVLTREASASISVTEGGKLLQTQLNRQSSEVVRAPEALDHGWPTTLRALASMARRDGHYAPEAEAGKGSTTAGCSAEALSTDGRYALCLQGMSELVLQDRQAGQSLWHIASPLLPVGPLELSAERHLILVGGARAEAALLHSTDGRLLGRVVLTNIEMVGGELVARGYATDTQGKIQFFGPESERLARWARCGIGPFRLPFELCRSELLDPGLLPRLLAPQK